MAGSLYKKNINVVEKVFIGKDNTIKLELFNDDAVADLSVLTRVTLEFGSTLLDSDVVAAFDWSEGSGILAMSLGMYVTSEYNGFARLVLYTAANPNGLVWIDRTGNSRLELRIHD